MGKQLQVVSQKKTRRMRRNYVVMANIPSLRKDREPIKDGGNLERFMAKVFTRSMEIDTLDNLSIIKNLVLEQWNCVVEKRIKENGKKTFHMDLELSFIQIMIVLKDNGLKDYALVKELISMQMAINTLAIGVIMCLMVKVIIPAYLVKVIVEDGK